MEKFGFGTIGFDVFMELDKGANGKVDYRELVDAVVERRATYSTDAKQLLTAMSFEAPQGRGTDDTTTPLLMLSRSPWTASSSASSKCDWAPARASIALSPANGGPGDHTPGAGIGTNVVATSACTGTAKGAASCCIIGAGRLVPMGTAGVAQGSAAILTAPCTRTSEASWTRAA